MKELGVCTHPSTSRLLRYDQRKSLWDAQDERGQNFLTVRPEPFDFYSVRPERRCEAPKSKDALWQESKTP